MSSVYGDAVVLLWARRAPVADMQGQDPRDVVLGGSLNWCWAGVVGWVKSVDGASRLRSRWARHLYKDGVCAKKNLYKDANR